MPRDVKAGSVEERIIRVLAERYPVALEDVALALGLRRDVVDLAVKRLTARGLVVVESPGGTRYVALSGAGFRVLGLNPSEAAALRKKGKLPPATPRPEDDPAFL